MKEFLIDEIKFILGRNAQDNFDLIDLAKEENENYLWLHIDDYPSGHGVIFQEEPTKEVIIEGAKIVKEYSKLKYHKKIKIVYTELKNVTKTKIAGMVTISNSKKIKI